MYSSRESASRSIVHNVPAGEVSLIEDECENHIGVAVVGSEAVGAMTPNCVADGFSTTTSRSSSSHPTTTSSIDRNNIEHTPRSKPIRYCITGSAAHQRIQPLLPKDWIDCSPPYSLKLQNRKQRSCEYHPRNQLQDQPQMEITEKQDTLSFLPSSSVSSCDGKGITNNDFCRKPETNDDTSDSHYDDNTDTLLAGGVDFLWENTPRNETKAIREGHSGVRHGSPLGPRNPNSSINHDTTMMEKTRRTMTTLKCYSHLPNGTNILDSKWALARLLQQPQPRDVRERNPCQNHSSVPVSVPAAVLETHCFRGPDGYVKFVERVGLSEASMTTQSIQKQQRHLTPPQRPRQLTVLSNTSTVPTPVEDVEEVQDFENGNDNFDDLDETYPDLDPSYQIRIKHKNKDDEKSNNCYSFSLDNETIELSDRIRNKQKTKKNMWVVKDAMSNGAGGIWIVGPNNWQQLLPTLTTNCCEHENHDSSSNNNNSSINNSNSTSTNNLHCSNHTLISDHMYVAQQYASPMVLFQRRKFHVRVYGLVTATGHVYMHNQCFLHVANDPYPHNQMVNSTNNSNKPSDNSTHPTTTSLQNDNRNDFGLGCDTNNSTSNLTTKQNTFYPDSVHITNCCANSHDQNKFAGEILADLSFDGFRRRRPDGTWIKEDDDCNNNMYINLSTSSQDYNWVIGLLKYRASMESSLALVAKNGFPFLDGGTVNGGFEYLGLDYILSSKSAPTTNIPTSSASSASSSTMSIGECDHGDNTQYIAYLLEINAPPSQDTATKLTHAEQLHNTVLRDLLTLYVFPCVLSSSNPVSPHITEKTKPIQGGWRLIYNYYIRSNTNTNEENNTTETTTEPTEPTSDFQLRTTNTTIAATKTATNTDTAVYPSWNKMPYSKAVLLNRIKWAIYERKQQQKEQLKYIPSNEQNQNNLSLSDLINTNGNDICMVRAKKAPNGIISLYCASQIAQYARQFFPYYSSSSLSLLHFCKCFFPYTSNRFHNVQVSTCYDDINTQFNFNSPSAGSMQRHSHLTTSIVTKDATNINNQDSGCSSMEHVQKSQLTGTPVFFENGGGSQVPNLVIKAMNESLTNRHRDVIGANSKDKARQACHVMLGSTPDKYEISFGANASSLFSTLAERYVQSHWIRPNDIIVLCTENHTANTQPWIAAAKAVGAIVRWWHPPKPPQPTSKNTFSNKNEIEIHDYDGNGPHNHQYRVEYFKSLKQCLQTPTTSCTKQKTAVEDDSHPPQNLRKGGSGGVVRIIAITHVSNIMGYVHDIIGIRDVVRQVYGDRSSMMRIKTFDDDDANAEMNFPQLIVDGVSAVPHVYPNVAVLDVDWYIVSMHKFFGPHIGVACGKINDIFKTNDPSTNHLKRKNSGLLEIGTVNYEGCEGIVGTEKYLQILSQFSTVCDVQNTTTSILAHGEINNSNTTTEEILLKKQNIIDDNILIYRRMVMIREAYRLIRIAEQPLARALLEGLHRSSNIRILGSSDTSMDLTCCWASQHLRSKSNECAYCQYHHSVTDDQNDDINKIVQPDFYNSKDTVTGCWSKERTDHQKKNPQNSKTFAFQRVPIISFTHKKISSKTIVDWCLKQGNIVCRNGWFLCTNQFRSDHFGCIRRDISLVHDNTSGTTSTERIEHKGSNLTHDDTDGIVRLSLAHYNTLSEVDELFRVLQSIPQWFS